MWLSAVLVAGLVFWLYWPSGSFDFIRLDDGDYVCNNPVVEKGLTVESVKWAFSNVKYAIWDPLTWISYMTDVELFGVKPGPMHLVNAGMHAVATSLLFLLLVQLLSGWRSPRNADSPPGPVQKNSEPSAVSSKSDFILLISAMVAALFWGLHPLRVESVAWISSRKDVLSVLFCLAGLMAYLADIRRWRARSDGLTVGQSDSLTDQLPNRLTPTIHHPPSTFHPLSHDGPGTCSWHWWVALCCFILGYAAKPTLMIFPAFAAILEWLETGRVRWKPIAVLGCFSAVLLALTMYAQESAMMEIGWQARILNALVSFSVYVRQLFIPTGLSLFYPYAEVLPGVAILLGALTAVACVACAVYCWRRVPVVTAMLVWFAAALVPVIGLIQIGSASHADRYMYLPTLGASVGAAFGLHALLRRVGVWQCVLVCAATGAICLGYAVAADRYLRVWENNFTVFYHAVESVPNNARAWQHLGSEYANRLADPDKGIECYRRSLALATSDECGGQLALALAIRGNTGDFAEVHRLCAKLEGAIGGEALDSEGGALTALGVVAMREQRWEDAVKWFGAAVKRGKTRGSVYLWYGMVLYNTGRITEAECVFMEAAANSPEEKVRTEARMRLEMLQRRGLGPRR